MENSFGPVVDDSCTILVLGSLPSIQSLGRQQYYGNPHNRFWYYLFSAFNEILTENYEERKQTALRHQVAIWDVVKCAERKGSADSAIRNALPNDIPSLLAKYRNIRKIIFNGSFAYQSYVRFFGTPPIPFEKLLSTSPACAGRDNEKRDAWHKALRSFEITDNQD